MSLRRSLIVAGLAGPLAVLALAPSPALARHADGYGEPDRYEGPDRESGEAGIDGMADKLRDPASQIAVAAMLSSMSQALLDMRIGPFVQAMDKAGLGGERVRDLPPDARLGDIAGHGTRAMPENIARETPRMMGQAAGMAGAMKDMLPQLKAIGRRMKDAMPRY